jgi:hypothetical protein
MDIQEDEIAKVVAELEEKEERDMEAAARGFGQSMFESVDDGETDQTRGTSSAAKDTRETPQSNRAVGNGASQ